MGNEKRWHAALRVEEVPEGEVRKVVIESTPIAIYRIGGSFFATHNVCTHDHIGLCEGYLENDTIECPAHQAIFHVPTGRVLQGPAKTDLPVFPVRVDNDTIYVEL
jgi:nitrite reductase/ring-hydroxylating ferredoxin subunit